MYQHIRDMNKLTQRDEVHKELIEYHRLKQSWGLEHIKLKLSWCIEKFCKDRPKRILHENMRNEHTAVLGRYLDTDNISSWAFLGTNLKDANADVLYIKRFFL